MSHRGRPGNSGGRSWTYEELIFVRDALRKGHNRGEITAALNHGKPPELHRTVKSVEARINYEGRMGRLGAAGFRFYSEQRSHTREVRRIPDATMAEWRRYQELEPASVTAAFCGDPLPGRSALDRRR